MIRKQDILDRAAEWLLRPEVVEKDYVLGWVLVGLAMHPTARNQWIFKGGTSIRKCYVETYRFSEDIDLSLVADAPYTQGAIREALREVIHQARELSGIEFPEDLTEVRTRHDKLGRPTYQGRISYRGPLATPSLPRILFDITQHEPLLDPPAARPIFQPYPDAPESGATVLAYSLNELLAEKTRALYERTRPRDLYDVVYLLENEPETFDFPRVRDLFSGKCRAKNVKPPTAAELIRVIEEEEELRTEWANMLAHQLPSLPRLEDMLQRLPGLLQWIDVPAVVLPAAQLAAPPIPRTAMPVAAAGIHYWGVGLPLETARFAGANRLCIEFDYDGRRRVAEPYSLRQAGTGNLLLYAWERGSTHIKAFNVDKMRNLRPTDILFLPRFRVELSSQVPPSAPLAPTPEGHGMAIRQRAGYEPTYTFVCPYCRKKFRRSENNSRLGKHKRPESTWDCPGRVGYLESVS